VNGLLCCVRLITLHAQVPLEPRYPRKAVGGTFLKIRTKIAPKTLRSCENLFLCEVPLKVPRARRFLMSEIPIHESAQHEGDLYQYQEAQHAGDLTGLPRS